MTFRVILISLIFSTNVFANLDMFKVSRKVHDYQCGQALEQYSFEETFKRLFSDVYHNGEIDLLRSHMDTVDQRTKENCQQKGYFDFEVQKCYESCHDSLEVGRWDTKARIKREYTTLCLATCSTIHHNYQQLHTDAYEINRLIETSSNQ